MTRQETEIKFHFVENILKVNENLIEVNYTSVKPVNYIANVRKTGRSVQTAINF